MAKPLAPGIPEYRKRIEDDLAQIRNNLAMLESGELRHGEKMGSGKWCDTTPDLIAQDKRTIAVYEAILAALDKGVLL